MTKMNEQQTLTGLSEAELRADEALYDELIGNTERLQSGPAISWYEHPDRNGPLSQVLILSGSSHPQFAQQIATHLGFEQTGQENGRFEDESVRIRLGANMRDRKTLFVGSPHGVQTGNHFDEICFAASTARNHWATYQGMLAVVPYFVYGRQDRESYGQREPPSAHIMIQRMKDEGVLGMMTMDPHNDAVTGSFRGPWERLYGSYFLTEHIKRTLPGLNPVVVSPDAGGGKRAKHFASYFGTRMVSADKFRAEAGEQSGSIEFGSYIPDVTGADCIIPDDELSSGKTLEGVGETLKRMGANSVIAVATHGKFVNNGRVRMMSSKNVDLVFVTDTLPQPESKRTVIEAMGMEDKIRVVHVAGVFGEALRIVLGGNGGTMQQLYEIPFEQFNIY